ncbi:MAG: ATP-dependent Clp protease adaptor ClpS [Phycisphaerae bacterium]|nr:ATP-dependent Clp protease adaptor ClpS [Phycisphaerae bacterium]
MADEHDSGTALQEQTRERAKTDAKPKILPPYHVILLDDNDHTYEYVIEMLMRLFGHSLETAFQMACEVDATGRVIVDTTSKERAEFKQEQIHAYGPDKLLERSRGSMSSVIEPAVT